MYFLLKKQINDVQTAQREHSAAEAMDNHRSLQAKARIRRLLSSKKGITTAFAAGMLKGASTSPKKSKSNFTSLVVKQVLMAWLGTSAISDTSSSGANLSE